jgi:tetratricopeptide (TPR) repeat protein
VKYAEACERGDKSPLNVTSIEKEFSGLFANYESWREVLRANGPVDEPSFLLQTGRVLLAGGNNRQALASFKRCVALAPDWLAAKYWVAQSYIKLRDFDHALETADRMQQSRPQDGPGLSSVLECRVMALRGLGRTNEATACLESFIAQPDDQTAVLSAAADLYSQAGQFEKEVALLDRLLQREARRPDLICRKGLAQMELARYDEAIKTLTSALTLAPRNENARLLRAVACLGADKLDEARIDYEALAGTGPNGRIALFGLGTVAWRQQNTNAAIRYYQEFLTNGVGRTRQEVLALERLNQMQASMAVKP